jgi:hypothetical protein
MVTERICEIKGGDLSFISVLNGVTLGPAGNGNMCVEGQAEEMQRHDWLQDSGAWQGGRACIGLNADSGGDNGSIMCP